MRCSQISNIIGSPSASRAFSAGNEPIMPALHWAITRSGFEMINKGEPTIGRRSVSKRAGKAMAIPSSWRGGPAFWHIVQQAPPRAVARGDADKVLKHFEQASSPHATAHAHGAHNIARAAAFAFDQRMAHHARARHAVGVANGNGTAVDVQQVLRNAQ